MYYEMSYTQISRFGNKNLRTSVRALIVFFIVMALLTSLPMSSMDAEAARMVNTFDDGTDSKTVEFTTDPLPGERTTLFIKIKGDVTVTQAALNTSAVLLERSLQATGGGLTFLGYGIDTSGDYNGDGFTDWIVTAPGATNTVTAEGFLTTVRGGAGGFTFPPHVTIWGGTANAMLGWGLSTGSDLNKDGYADLVTSRIEMDFATSTGTGTGDVLIFWGGTAVNTTADLTLSAGARGDMFGYSVSTNGDVNGDGNPDLVVGSPRNEVNTSKPGRAFIYYGTGNSSFPTTPDVVLIGTDNGDGFGRVVHICGDVNGDGVDDVFVGAPGHNGTSDFDVGKAYIFYGGTSGVDTNADWTYVGKNEEDYLGFSGTGMSDVNNDGIDDLAIGVPLWDDGTTTDAGEALVFYGSASGPSATPDVTIKGDTSSGLLGVDVAHGGDINNDSLGDLVIGAPNTNNGSLADAGHIQVHFGNVNGMNSTPEKILRGWTANADMGYSVGPGGDGNGDGYDDISTGDITGEVTYAYYGGPSAPDPAVYVDDVEVWSHSGSYLSKDRTDDFSDELNAYIATHQGDLDENGDLLIPINISMSAKGLLKIDDLVVQFYRLVQPTNLAITAMPSGSALKLTWDDHTTKGDDISKMAIEMWNGTGWEELEKVAKNAKEYIVSGLEDGQSYSFRILAFDGGVQRYSAPSDVAIGVPGDTMPPAKITGIIAIEDRDLMGINVSWATGDEDVVNYEVWSNKTGTWAILANISTPMLYYVDTEVDDGPRYYYKVRAWDEVPLVGEFSKIVWGVLYDLTPPMIPENLQVHIVPVGRALKITWDLNDDDTVAYSIESNKTGQWREMSLVGSSVDNIVDTGLTDGTRYYYRLSAQDESGNPSDFTAIVSGVPVDSEPPMAPMGLEVTPRSVGNILRLTWVLNDDDTVGYHIYIFGTSDWEFVTNVAEDVNQFEVGDLENGVTYRIRIKAVDLAERESDWSNEATGIPTDTHPPNIPQGVDTVLDPNGGAVNLSWDPNNDDTVAYNVLEWSGIEWVEIGTVTRPQTWYYINGLVNNQPYAYVIRSVDEADNESPNSQRVDVIPKDTVKPEPPVFIDLPIMTNQKDQSLTGHSEPNAKIITYLNLYPQEPVFCDENGNFQVTLRLKNGPNEVFAEAEDDAGKSEPSARHTIHVDQVGPLVESTNPEDGTKDLGRLNLTWDVYFNEEVKMDSIKAYLTKGRVDHDSLVANIGDASNIIPVLKDYNNVRSLAKFEVMEELQSGSTYSILIYEVEDIAGNPLNYPSGAYSFYIETTAGGGGGGGGGGGDDGGLGSIALYIGAAIAIIIVIVIAVFLVSQSGTREEIQVDRSIMAAPVEALTPEQTRPDIGALYAEAYEERGEGDTEHHQVEGGMSEWLSEQQKSSEVANTEAKRLMEEMARGAPPPEDTGPIPGVPPGLVEERAVPAYHMDTPEPDAEVEAEPETEMAESEAEEDVEEGSEAEEDVDEGSEDEEDVDEGSEDEDDAASLLDELDEELSKDGH
jgi:hypothetical protein